MTKIKDIQALREMQIQMLEGLASGDMDIKHVGVASKACEGIMSGVHLELEYAKALGREPNIPFMGDCLGPLNLKYVKNKDAKNADVMLTDDTKPYLDHVFESE